MVGVVMTLAEMVVVAVAKIVAVIVATVVPEGEAVAVIAGNPAAVADAPGVPDMMPVAAGAAVESVAVVVMVAGAAVAVAVAITGTDPGERGADRPTAAACAAKATPGSARP